MRRSRLLTLLLAACSSGPEDLASLPSGPADPAQTGDADQPPCQSFFSTPRVRPEPSALVVTRAALAPAFQRYADFHTLTGIDTAVATLETICGGACDDSDPLHDTAKRLKEYLSSQPGLSHVVLGGDIELVPSRWVYDSYQNPLDTSFSFDASFASDYYFSDLSEWDTNGDGHYAEDGYDSPDLTPELAVARIPVSTPEEAAQYLAKVVRYSTAYPAERVTQSLLVSDIAATYVVDIDSAWYFEAEGRTASLMPEGFAVRKLYATALNPEPLAEPLTMAALMSAFSDGTNIIVHAGHSSPDELIGTADGVLDGAGAYAMQNDVYPLLFSCGCVAGDFSEPNGYSASDAAGELLVNAPNGGAIAYLGNVPQGLGLAGGSQFIDEMLAYIRGSAAPRLGDAYLAAHTSLPSYDTFTVPYVGIDVPVIDQSSYEWTQKGVVLLGDPLVEVWKVGRPRAPTITAQKEALCDGSLLHVALSAPAHGRLRLVADGSLYEVSIAGSETAFVLPGSPARVSVAVLEEGLLPGYAELALP